MLQKFTRIAEATVFAALAVTSLFSAAWAGPPAPPVIALPAVPVGGPEVTIATTLVIAGYGIWKSRK